MSEPALPIQHSFSARTRRLWALTGLLVVGLFISFLLQLPTHEGADWGEFAFYDAGTTLKGDMLLAKGYVPTVDFGYTHGLLSLVLGRAGFALLGRTAGAFLALTVFTEIVMAWAIARILVAAGISRKGVMVFLAALPMAIMPAYLTLTHPLEAMVILLGLAAQAEGRRAQALALATVCLFVKPSMGYVYGFLLVVIVVWNIVRHTRVGWGERALSIGKQLLPAATVGVVLYGGLSLWVGPTVVWRTLLPLTGAKTYAATHFGFFTASGRAFWLKPTIGEMFVTPAFAYLLAAVASIAGAAWAAWMLIRRPVVSARQILSRQRAWEILLTAGLLNTAFLVGFYGWPGSWAYYSYLPCLGLAIVVVLMPVRRDARLAIALAVIVVLLLSQAQLIGTIYAAWHDKARLQGTGGLWCYPEQFTEWEEAVQTTRGKKAMVMTNGWVPELASPQANVELPDAWFPELGIPTAREMARVKKQAEGVEYVILWRGYQDFENVWYSEALAAVREHFHPVFTGKWFTVLQRDAKQNGN